LLHNKTVKSSIKIHRHYAVLALCCVYTRNAVTFMLSFVHLSKTPLGFQMFTVDESINVTSNLAPSNTAVSL